MVRKGAADTPSGRATSIPSARVAFALIGATLLSISHRARAHDTQESAPAAEFFTPGASYIPTAARRSTCRSKARAVSIPKKAPPMCAAYAIPPASASTTAPI